MGGFRGEPTPPRTPPRYLWVPPPVLSWPRRAPSRPIDHHSPTSIPLLLSQPPPTTRSPTVDLPPPPPPPKPIDPPKTPPPVGSVLWALLESRRPSPRRAFMWGGNPTPMTSFPPPPLGGARSPPQIPPHCSPDAIKCHRHPKPAAVGVTRGGSAGRGRGLWGARLSLGGGGGSISRTPPSMGGSGVQALPLVGRGGGGT